MISVTQRIPLGAKSLPETSFYIALGVCSVIVCSGVDDGEYGLDLRVVHANKGVRHRVLQGTTTPLTKTIVVRNTATILVSRTNILNGVPSL